MAETTQQENTQTSSSRDDAPMQPLTITCYDPKYPDKPCPICNGLGVVKYAVTPDDRRFGKLFRCPNNPIEDDTDRQSRLRQISNLEAFKDKTFRNFEVENPTYSPVELESLTMARGTVESYAKDMQGWLLLQGAFGTGKTHLAAAVGNERLRYGDVVIFITTPDLLDHLRGTYAPGSSIAYDELFDRVRNAELLILDDIGTENPSEWAREKLFQILNHRYTHRLPTVITTNIPVEDLDPRIASRMMDNNVIRRAIINAPDYRSTGVQGGKGRNAERALNYSKMTFDNFDFETNVPKDIRENLLMAVETAYRYAENPRQENVWLLLMGLYGCGKTHLAAAITNYRLERYGEANMLITVPDLLDHLRTAFDPKVDATFDKLFHQVRNVPLLVLDDLGTESTKPWAQEKLFQILDHRYVSRLPTVITTSKKMNELNARIVSRLLDHRVCRNIAITAKSYALRMKRK